MRITELKTDSYIIQWFGEIKPSNKTKKNYLDSMQIYTEYLGKTPEELIKEAEADIKSGLLPRERKVKQFLNNFYAHLQDKELADNTIQSHMGAVRSYYKSFDIEIPKLSRTEHATAPKEENLPIPIKSDLQAAIKVCDPLEKALMLVGVSSGLSTNEIISLKIKQIKEGYDPETKITTLSMRRYKKKIDFITFLSPEASQSVLDYIDYRNRETKSSRERRVNQLENQSILSDGNFLFCKQNVPNSFLDTRNDEMRKLSSDIIMRIYRTISEKAGKNSPDGSWNLLRAHNMRRYFNSAMLNAGADSFFTEFLMGHKLDKTRAAYFRASPEKLREQYQKYVPFLTIQKEEDITNNPIFQERESYRQALEAQLAKSTIENSELQELQKKLEKVEEFEKIFQKEMSRLRESFENPKTDADKIMADHRKRMANDANYREDFNRNNITLKPKKEIKEVTNEDYKDAGYWDYEGRNS